MEEKWTAPGNGECVELILEHTPLVPTRLGTLPVSQPDQTHFPAFPPKLLHKTSKDTVDIPPENHLLKRSLSREEKYLVVLLQDPQQRGNK